MALAALVNGACSAGEWRWVNQLYPYMWVVGFWAGGKGAKSAKSAKKLSVLFWHCCFHRGSGARVSPRGVIFWRGFWWFLGGVGTLGTGLKGMVG
jgi:hypothetical protein